jgi:uncharacterized protein YciI
MGVTSMRVTTIVFILASCVLWLQRPAVADGSSSEAARTWYAVEINVGPAWDDSISPYDQAYFKEHSVHLKELRSAGHIVMGARYSDVGLLVFSARSADEIRVLMDKDPSMQAGTFSYEIYPMNVFYPGLVGDKK